MSENVTARVHIERIYLSELEFKPKDMRQLLELKWRPKVNISLASNYEELEDSCYEVKLQATLDVTIATDDAIHIKVVQAGVFKIETTPALNQILAVECPNILFPYIREALDSVMVKASLPPFALAPVNFREVVQSAMEQNKPITPPYSKPVVN